jgi:hypothetical protein
MIGEDIGFKNVCKLAVSTEESDTTIYEGNPNAPGYLNEQ